MPLPSSSLTSSLRATALVLTAALSFGLTPAIGSAAPSLNPAPAIAPGAPLPAEDPAPSARTPLPEPTASAPTPDVLEVDLAGGSTAETARDRRATEFGTAPVIGADAALGREVAAFDGTNAIGYDYSDGFTDTASAVTLECTVRFDGGLTSGDSEATGNFCGAKEAGGYSLTVYGSTLRMMINVDGTYYGAGVEVEQGRWYHATGVWDGKSVALYLDGEKVAEQPAAGTAVTPPTESARQFFLGADTNSGGKPQFHGITSIANAGIFSRALSAEEITARYVQAFAHRSEDQVAVDVTSPAPGSLLTTPTTLTATIDHEELLAAPLEFTLDGEEVSLGDQVGPGLQEGDHTIRYRGRDAFGQEIDGQVSFTSTSVPTGDGATQQNGSGTAQLTARATHPSGAALRTTFLEGEVAAARSGEQGVIDPALVGADGTVPGDVELSEASTVQDALHPSDGQALDAPATSDVPALRSEIPFTAEGQTILWRGRIDPAREARLLLLNSEMGTYEVVDAQRGSADQQIELSAPATAAHGTDGTVTALVLGTDPFADDLDEPVGPSFAAPESFDFSLMHITDTQYLTEGATERPSAEERQQWADAYAESYRWAAEHGTEHKLAYVAHTGDIIENWNTGATDRGVAEEEFAFASETQEILEETGIVHSVLPGNHDNLGGGDTGSGSLYNQYFGSERYEALAEQESWKRAGAEYHPWKPGDNDNSYTLFSAGGEDFIALSLGYDVTQEEVDWAGGVLDQYSTRNALLLTHAYAKPSEEPDGRGGTFSHDGTIIHDQILTQHPNVALVLSGHEHGVSIGVRKDVGSTGNHVVELLADYQFYEVGSDQLGLTEAGGYGEDTGLRFGSAFFRLLQVDLDRGEVSVDTYSPYLDEFGATAYDTRGRYDGREDDFRLPVQFAGRTTTFTTDTLMGLTPSDRVIEEVTHGSGEQATASWRGLEAGTGYGWFAVSRDESRAVDPRELRTRALGASAEEYSEGIVQFSAFTATGSATEDESGTGEQD